ncbi:LexA family protein [Salinisphaera hydrothermalis]|uniref:Repressor protein c2 n=1 Tax=Salinisphaera hydrothermalis (strain C41B8) TaxID=1304275 RepID=A0A084INR4_SALHC|nr:XRE family transcriptional regulator [Salinisphaera hydrothermalis]KEZ78348.1 repressor protein c2 [Salinisphaera hydrothermalis C41B8]
MADPQFAQRFRQACNEQGIKTTQKALAAYFGVSEITARNWWHGEKLPGMNNARKAAEKLDVNVEWLLSGRGPRYASLPDTTNVRGDNVRPVQAPFQSAPIVSWANAGNWAEVVDSYEPGDAEHWYPIPPNVKCSASSFWTEVQGRSMINTTGGRSYPPGSYILVDPELRDAVVGNLVLARLDDTHEVTFKRLNVENGRYYLEPLNTQYSIIEIDTPAQIIGTVLIAIVAA